MDNELLIKTVQAQIGYNFKNADLLLQAFTRRPYAKENGGEDNEVLEFIGDSALEIAAVRFLASKFGKLQNVFSCSAKEGKLTLKTQQMVKRTTLAGRIDELGFAEYLFLGKGDIIDEILKRPSVKADLFEAIVGAVAIDSGWDLSAICRVVETMLNPEEFFLTDIDTNYYRKVKLWGKKLNGRSPQYKYKEASYASTWWVPFDGISQSFPYDYNYSRLKFHCYLTISGDFPVYRGFGATKAEARWNTYKLAYEDLTAKGVVFESTIRDEIENPNKDEAANQLRRLADRGYFSTPVFSFTQKKTKKGKNVCLAVCTVADIGKFFFAVCPTKKEAKKEAAFKMLQYVLYGKVAKKPQTKDEPQATDEDGDFADGCEQQLAEDCTP